MIVEALIFILSFSMVYFSLPWIAQRLFERDIKGRDVNKEGNVEVPEMGGISVVVSFFVSMNVLIFLSVYDSLEPPLPLLESLSLISVALSLGIIGMVDDLITLDKKTKILLPVLASIPLVALNVGVSKMTIPFLGQVDFGVFYPLFIIPLTIMVGANLTNIFAGFNGMEAGMGIVMYLSLIIISSMLGLSLTYWVSIVMVALLFGFFLHNKFPAKVFPGDSLTLLIGGTAASLSVIENFESLLPFLFFPYAVDAFFKILSGIPTSGWWGNPNEGRLYYSGRPKGLAQAVISLFKEGIREKDLVLIFILFEAISVSFGILYSFFFLKHP